MHHHCGQPGRIAELLDLQHMSITHGNGMRLQQLRHESR